MTEEATTTKPVPTRKGKLKLYGNGKPQYELFKQLMLHNNKNGKTVGPFDYDGEVVLTNGPGEESSEILMLMSDSVPTSMLPVVVEKKEAEATQARDGVTLHIPGKDVMRLQFILFALTFIILGMYVEAFRAWFLDRPSLAESRPASYYATR